MIRNFLSGIVIGGAVAGLGVVVISQIAPQPEPISQAANGAMAPEPAVDAAAVPADTASVSAVPTSASTTAETEPLPTPSTESATVAEAPAVDGTAPLSPGDLPQPDIIDEAPVTPEVPAAGMEAPEVPAGDIAPLAPELADRPSDPSAELAPQVSADLPPAAAAAVDDTLLAPLPEAKATKPAAEMTMDQPAVAEVGPPEQPGETPPAVENLPSVQDIAPIAPEGAPSAERPVILPPPSTPKVLAPAPGLAKTVDGVTTGRLPSIGAADPAPAMQSPAELQPDDPRPVAKFARPFSDNSGKPAFAVVLIDTGEADLDRAQLAALPFPVSFVIDPLDPTAATAEAAYRAGGQEVVMLASGIPRGANPSDLEQTFQSNETMLPETVAVMDIGTGGFQDNRQLSAQVLPLIKDQGRGLLTFDRGLNAADQIARRDGVPSAVIFRELDAADEASPVIRRYLDRAAFKAAQEGRVVVLGSTRPETIAALMEWTVEGRSSSVTLAPLTAVMTKP